MSLASQLTERVTIQQQVLTDDGYGGQTMSWADFATVFAEVKPVYANWRERDVGGQIEATAGYRVAIRLRTDIMAAMRLVWKTHTLTIHSLHESGEELSMLAYEENV